MIDPDKLFGRIGNRMFQMAFIYAQMREGVIPDIYVQDFALFEKYSEEIKQWFAPEPFHFPLVSVHVRRGDYVDNPYYVDLTKTDYYERAVGLFPSKKFLIFSDDISFCKMYFGQEKFNTSKFYFSESNDELTDLNSMTGCTDHIIANSSFSWWGAFLGINPDKVVICPKQWYSDGVPRTTVPDTWKQI